MNTKILLKQQIKLGSVAAESLWLMMQPKVYVGVFFCPLASHSSYQPFFKQLPHSPQAAGSQSSSPSTNELTLFKTSTFLNLRVNKAHIFHWKPVLRPKQSPNSVKTLQTGPGLFVLS